MLRGTLSARLPSSSSSCSRGGRSRQCSVQHQTRWQQQQQQRRRPGGAGFSVQATLRAADEVQQQGGGDSEGKDPAQVAREARQAVTRRIKTLGEARRFKEAVQELASLADLGIEPDTQAATALLAACTRSRDMTLAEGIFEQLFGGFLTPDEVTFAVLLRGYGAKAPPDWGSVDATLTRMRSSYGIEPTAVSYNALLEACARSNDSDRALDVLDRMADDGVAPDEVTVSITSKKRAWRSYMNKLFG